MDKIQSIANLGKKPGFILTLILISFFLKGAFLATLFPIFVGQDEARHYNTVQFLAEPKEKDWPISQRIETDPPYGPSTLKYNYTQEIRETALAADDGQELFNTIPFSSSHEGRNEALINSRPWRQYNIDYRPNIAGRGESLYHTLASYIEKAFSEQSILIRFYLSRIFSIFLSTLTVLLSYLIIKNIGFSEKTALIMTAIVAFQPRFSIYSVAINYDVLLILIFALFMLGGILALKNGANLKNLAMMMGAILVGYYTKGTAVVLLGMFIPLLIFLIYERISQKSKHIRYAFYFLFLLLIMAAWMFFRKYLPLNNTLAGIIASMQVYLDKSLTMGRFALTARTYWGVLTWVRAGFMDHIVNIIWLFEALAAVGLAFFFFSKQKLAHLPEKKYVLFLLAMIIALQLGIRAYDWKLFAQYGNLEIGTPGRYFLPNLAAHIILVFTGLGMLLRKEKYFDGALILGMISMFAFSMYLLFDVIIFRFYL